MDWTHASPKVRGDSTFHVHLRVEKDLLERVFGILYLGLGYARVNPYSVFSVVQISPLVCINM